MPLQALQTDFAGTKRRLFWLAVKTSVLTVLTLGFYRFWMKTRLRRFYWSSIRPGGVPLEYTGTGVEKLMGFLIAVVFLAFYIGIFNLLLMFLSFAVLQDSFAAYFTSFIGIIPIYFYAQYRARRYILARTRWRGLRFGIDPAAWSYAWRAMVHWLLTLITLGVLYPRQVFWLEKFRIDRTWFGKARFVQDGRWTMLLPAAIHFYIGVVIVVASAVGGYFVEAIFFGLIPGGIWLGFGVMHFNVKSYRILAAHKRLGENISFKASPRTGRVIGIYLLGSFIGFMCFFLTIIIVFGAIGGFIAVTDPDAMIIFDTGKIPENKLVVVLAGLGYFSAFIFWGAFTQVFVTLPLMRHYAETLEIENGHRLADIQQRDRDEMSEAEGFAEALDIGAAI